MRPIPLLALLLIALALFPRAADAAIPCSDELVRCTVVRVALEPDEPALGEVLLYVQRVRRPGTRRGRPVVILPGGPGQSATPDFTGADDPVVRALLEERREVIVFDPRGTGRSGLIRCPELQRDVHLRSPRGAEACARRLGDRRGSYGIDEHVDDLEAVRRELGVPRLDLFGVSYGTLVAERYAQAFPTRVGRLLLDSVVPPGGASAEDLELFRAMPRVLEELCEGKRCVPYTKDPAGEVAGLVRTIRAEGPLRGFVVDRRGRRRAAELGTVGLLDVILEGDFNPAAREALVPAVIAARRGDPAPLLRLSRQVSQAAGTLDADSFSAGAYAAGSCEVLDQPWDPAADPAARLEQAREAVARLGEATFRPFDAQTILDADFLPLCLRWPAPREPIPSVVSELLPDVPTLMIAGEEDLRTPAEEARRVAAANRHVRLIVVPRVGHSVVNSDESGCAQRAALEFLLARGSRVRRCGGPDRISPPVPVPPRTTGELKTPRGVPARIGRTVQAVDLALDDVQLALAVGVNRGGGLRGGRYAASRGSVRMRGYEYVPGIRIDATPRGDGSLLIRTSGPSAARGRLVLTPGARIRGVVGGRRIRTRAGAGPPQSF
jgi:pimeloyl-ACP methyl ester carboxylesterase